MTSNLLDLIKRGLPADFSDLASKAVGESPGATQTALTAALPALVGAIAPCCTAVSSSATRSSA